MAEKKEDSKVELTEVATETVTAFKLPDGTVANMDGLLLWIANTLWDIKKAVA